MLTKNYLKSLFLLLCMIAGAGTAWAEDEVVATFDSGKLSIASAYATTYGGDNWSISIGGNSKSIGFNNKNCKTIDNNLGTGANASNYGIVVKSKNALADVNRITFVYTGGSGDGGKLYLASSENGTNWNAITLNSGEGLSAQGVTVSKNTTFTFEFEKLPSAYYGFILDKGNTTKAAYRFDNVVVNFISVPVGESSPLSSIAISGTYPTQFRVGDEFSHDGMTVTATYEDDSNKDVTTDATFSGYNMNEAGNQTVTVSYSENEVTKTTTYDILVLAPANLQSISLSGTYQTVFTEGDTFNHDGLIVTANYDDDSHEDVTASAEFTTPDMNKVGLQTITVTYEGKTATYDIIVNELPKYTVTFSDEGSVTQETAGASVTLPSRDAIGDYTFAGWSETNVPIATTTAPTIIPVGAYTPTANITLYPVYRMSEQSGETSEEWVEIFEAPADGQYAICSDDYFMTATIDSKRFKNGDTPSFKAGKLTVVPSSDCIWEIYKAADNNYRIKFGTNYVAATGSNNQGQFLTDETDDLAKWTITYDGGYVIENVGMAAAKKNKTLRNNGNYGWASYGASTGLAPRLFKKTTVAVETVYYWSSPVAAAVEKPVITVAENPFLFSTTVTITCETEGAAIKYSYDGENWNDYTVAFNITATTTIYAKAVKGNDESSVAQYTATKNLAEPTVAIDATGITNTNVFTGTAAGSLSAAVTYNEAVVEGAAITWSGNNDEVATINASTGVVTLVSAGSVTFTATYAGNSDYSEKAATYEMTVSNFDPNAPGTENNPYTVADAIAFINTLGSATSSTEVYVSGIISQIDSYNSKYGSIQYWISDDGTTNGQMEVYSGLGLNGAEFSALSDLQLGDVVTVKGYVKMYNTTPEFDKNNQLVSLYRKQTPELAWSVDSYTATYGESNTYPTLTNPNSVTVAYSSSDTNIATIDPSTGEITLKANGETDITATFEGDEIYRAQEVSYTLTVTGLKESAEISFSEVEINMAYDEDYTGQALTNPNSVIVTYESSDPEVAEVDANSGELMLLKAGTVTITANFAGNATYAAGSASYTLNVTKADAGLAFADAGPFYVAPNADFEVPALTNPHSLVVNWSSTDENVAVADGSAAVIGSKLGTAVITASFAGDDRYNEGSASYTIVVSNDVVVTWDLSTDQTATATAEEMTWTNTNATMAAAKGSASTATNNYYPGKGDYSSTRFYKNSTLTINPLNGYAIKYVVFTATTNSYASALANSTWTNALAAASETTVTVIPTDGTAAVSATIGATTGHSSVVVTLTKSFGAKFNSEGYATFAANAPLDFTDDSEFSAWQITGVSGNAITFSKITGSVAAGTGVLLMGTASESISIPVAASGTDISATNKFIGITAATTIAADEYFGLSGNKFVKVNAGTIPAGKALLPASEIPAGARELTFVFEDGQTTGIESLNPALSKGGDTIYDLQGRKVAQPTKGLYIKNGKKVVMK